MDASYLQNVTRIRARMEQLGYSQGDLAKVVGLKSRASEILNKNESSPWQ
jgi:HTH-type transcriptional regulator / antitoxin HigA